MRQAPILWTFRRCPYAMRARLAVAVSGVPVELREIVLRDKPDAFLKASASATVPCLQTGTDTIDESLDIMIWALAQNDPEGWMRDPDYTLVSEADGPFKAALDRYKYPTRYEDAGPVVARSEGITFLRRLERRLALGWLSGAEPRLADMAILPFVRQFAHVDAAWFTTLDLPRVHSWLAAFKSSERFLSVMAKYPAWRPDVDPIIFPRIA